MANIKLEDVQFSPFTEGKIRVWFHMIDVGRDGHMCKADFMSIADRFVKVDPLSPHVVVYVRLGD